MHGTHPCRDEGFVGPCPLRGPPPPGHATIYVSYASIYLHDEGTREGPSSRYESSRRHLAVVLFRREDRRPRLERRGQELAAEDHGRGGHELSRRGVQSRQRNRRVPASGAATQSDEERPRQR